MSARRWPVITIALILMNVCVFLATHQTMEDQSGRAAVVKEHLAMLAAMHPELDVPPQAQEFVNSVRKRNPQAWERMHAQQAPLADAWDAKTRMMDDPEQLQAEMDSLGTQYSEITSTFLTERYAFIPAHPRPITYLTSMFLHGGWLHLIGNMWFLWLAGFVLEDAWGRVIYSAFYVVAGLAATQFYACLTPGSVTPTLGASGAVAALMGAFLVRFPNMKIELGWLVWLVRVRFIRFNAPAYALLPLWLLMEAFYGAVGAGGVAHWAHVGGFLFGALGAVALRSSGLEAKIDQSIEAEISLITDPEITHASDLIDQDKMDEAVDLLKSYLAQKPDSLDAPNLLQQIYWRKHDLPAYYQTVIELCGLHLKAGHGETALHYYDEFVNAGGDQIPATVWFDLCRALENQQQFEHALSEYQKLIATYPTEREAVMAQVAAARINLNRLHRPQDALELYEAVLVSPIPHLDLEAAIKMGIREAKIAMGATPAASAANQI
jgi:membrane associated rhomboid family serine protease